MCAGVCLWSTESEKTSRVLGQLKIDTSLTSVSGVQAACCMSLGCLTGGQNPFPPIVTSENMPGDIRPSQSQGAADSEMQGAAAGAVRFVQSITAQGDLAALSLET